MCEAPAEVWHIANKGKIEVGYDADLVLIDLEMTCVIRNDEQQTKSKWSPWHGESLKGKAIQTWVMGSEVYRLESGFEHFANSMLGEEIQFERKA